MTEIQGKKGFVPFDLILVPLWKGTANLITANACNKTSQKSTVKIQIQHAIYKMQRGSQIGKGQFVLFHQKVVHKPLWRIWKQAKS